MYLQWLISVWHPVAWRFLAALGMTACMNGRHCEARSNLPVAAVLRLLQLAQAQLRYKVAPLGQ